MHRYYLHGKHHVSPATGTHAGPVTPPPAAGYAARHEAKEALPPHPGLGRQRDFAAEACCGSPRQ
jgi:hypothetical protein